MRKVLIAILLLGLVLAVSYVKTRREEDRTQAVVAESRRLADRELGKLANSVDSLTAAVGDARAVYEDSIQQLNRLRDQEADSMKQLMLDYEVQLRDVTKPVEVGQADSVKLGNDEVIAEVDSADLHRRILLYYQKRFSDLPADLSDYERRVALSEIREETARRFSISVSQLNRMRKKDNLSF